jgi:uncharacterized protein (TIGR02996 family)
MNDCDLMIETICATPLMDGPILALADWLEEYGPAESAETCRWWVELRQRIRGMLPAGEWLPWPSEWQGCPRPPVDDPTCDPYQLRAEFDSDLVYLHRGWAANSLCAAEFVRSVESRRPSLLASPHRAHNPVSRTTSQKLKADGWLRDALAILRAGPAADQLRRETYYLAGCRAAGRYAIWLTQADATLTTYYPDDPDANDEARRRARGGCLSLAVAYFGTALDLTPAAESIVAAA